VSDITVSEIFGPTIQGEGTLIGTPTVFVRTGGCDFHCSWCDTLYAVKKRYSDQWSQMSTQRVLEKIQTLSGGQPLLVTLSGGNPALQPLGELIDLGKALGYRFALETQGSVHQAWFNNLDVLTLSPKPPSSGMRYSPDKLRACIEAAGDQTELVLKIVIDDEADLQWADQRRREYPYIPLVLQACNTSSDEASVDTETLNEKMRWLVESVNRLRWYGVRVLPQFHVLLWGNQRGV
jgi:7-carboxy-7-deazaguanine synthase